MMKGHLEMSLLYLTEMSEEVAIVASETTKFTRNDLSIYELACDPCRKIFRKTNLDRNDIDSVVLSTCSTLQYTSSIVSEMLGLKPKNSFRIDNLCSSGTSAIISTYAEIAAGLCDCALVIGAESGTNYAAKRLQWDLTRGSFNLPIHWASLFARTHMRKFGTTEEQMASVSVKNHRNSSKNPLALFRNKVTIEDVMKSRKISDPIKMLDCSYVCTGSSCILLASKRKAKELTDRPVWISGIGQKTICASLSHLLSRGKIGLESTQEAAREAYKMARTNPQDIDVVELHDAFTIMEIMAYEDLFFTSKGEGGKFVEQEQVSVNPRGGLLGCGHPIGCTGVAQTAEIAEQLAGRAGRTQIKGCKTGLIHNMAAAGSSSSVIILRG
jgi:acetyl-CoA C-acetyltransferase